MVPYVKNPNPNHFSASNNHTVRTHILHQRDTLLFCIKFPVDVILKIDVGDKSFRCYLSFEKRRPNN